MPPRVSSRYRNCVGLRDSKGRLYLSEREPYRFREHSDNHRHRVVEGDTLWGLAGRYFAPMERACGYWWVIADYQTPPIVDPTICLEVGSELVIPSLRVLTNIILNRRRR